MNSRPVFKNMTLRHGDLLLLCPTIWRCKKLWFVWCQTAYTLITCYFCPSEKLFFRLEEGKRKTQTCTRATHRLADLMTPCLVQELVLGAPRHCWPLVPRRQYQISNVTDIIALNDRLLLEGFTLPSQSTWLPWYHQNKLRCRRLWVVPAKRWVAIVWQFSQ